MNTKRILLLALLLCWPGAARGTTTWYAQGAGNWTAITWTSNANGTGNNPTGHAADGDIWDTNSHTVTLDKNIYEGNWWNPSKLQDTSGTPGAVIMNGNAICNGSAGASGNFTIASTVTISNSSNNTFPVCGNWVILGTVNLGSTGTYAGINLGTTGGTVGSGGTVNIAGNNSFCAFNRTSGTSTITIQSGGAINSPITKNAAINYMFVAAEPCVLSVASGGTLNCANGALFQLNGSGGAMSNSLTVAPGATFILGSQNFYTTDPGASNVISPTTYSIYGVSTTGSATAGTPITLNGLSYSPSGGLAINCTGGTSNSSGGTLNVPTAATTSYGTPTAFAGSSGSVGTAPLPGPMMATAPQSIPWGPIGGGTLAALGGGYYLWRRRRR